MWKLIASLVARVGLSSLVPGAGVVAATASAASTAISFFSTPVGKWIGVALIGAGLYAAGDIHRGKLDRARFEAKWATALRKADAERAARDEAVRRAVSVDADQRIVAIQRESEHLQSKVAEYEKALASAKIVACRVSPDDARRLHDLGYPGADRDPRRGSGGVRAYLAGGRAAGSQGR